MFDELRGRFLLGEQDLGLIPAQEAAPLVQLRQEMRDTFPFRSCFQTARPSKIEGVS